MKRVGVRARVYVDSMKVGIFACFPIKPNWNILYCRGYIKAYIVHLTSGIKKLLFPSFAVTVSGMHDTCEQNRMNQR